MNREKIYAHLESTDEGKALISSLRSEFGEITKLASRKGELKTALEAANKALETGKPILDAFNAAGITHDQFNTMIENSRKDESEIDVLRREMSTMKTEREREKIEKEESARETKRLKEEKSKGALKAAFSKELSSINPAFLDATLSNAITAGDITFNDKNEAGGKVDGVWVPLKEYSVDYMAKNKSMIVGKPGAGGNPSDGGGDDKGVTNADLLKKSPADLLAMRYENT